jgi:hypothetical protein
MKTMLFDEVSTTPLFGTTLSTQSWTRSVTSIVAYLLGVAVIDETARSHEGDGWVAKVMVPSVHEVLGRQTVTVPVPDYT